MINKILPIIVIALIALLLVIYGYGWAVVFVSIGFLAGFLIIIKYGLQQKSFSLIIAIVLIIIDAYIFFHYNPFYLNLPFRVTLPIGY